MRRLLCRLYIRVLDVWSCANYGTDQGRFLYRGFAVDVSAVSNFASIQNSLEHQLDIVADSGVRPEIANFFHTQRITVRPGARNEFDPEIGIEINAAVMPPQKPIVLHELLHALHTHGFREASTIRMCCFTTIVLGIFSCIPPMSMF